MANFRLLAIDGGGIRGLIPALVLQHIETQLGQPICTLFDCIAGTSTGGILALGLTKPGDDLKQRAGTLAQLYEERGATIFAEGAFRHALYWTLDRTPLVPQLEQRLGLPRHVVPSDLVRPKYSATGRHDVLGDFFKDTKLRDATSRLLIPSYDTDLRVPILFVSRDNDASSGDSYAAVCDQITMQDAAMATSAAPTYFPPHQVAGGPNGAYSLVDGGVYSNNPTGLAHAFLKPDTDLTGDVVVSLGTGAMTEHYPYSLIHNWGAAQWGPPALKMMFDGQSAAVALVMQRRLANAHYFRIQADLTGEFTTEVSDDLDDASPANIAAMKSFAAELIKKEARSLAQLCEILAQPRSLVNA
ncbi:MAG TPA: patatin-like phospholipase family protein [Polyangiales bacterium]|nr:patatin-like phospholipase family protein [Polyangiales bacterium]